MAGCVRFYCDMYVLPAVLVFDSGANLTTTVSIANSAFLLNSLDFGGGGALGIIGGKDVTITGTTFANNSASLSNGGAIFFFKDDPATPRVGRRATIDHCTFFGNTAPDGGELKKPTYVLKTADINTNSRD